MNRLKGASTYLIGPIQYAVDYGSQWRDEITPFLKTKNIKVLDPLKKACQIGKEDKNVQIKLKEDAKTFQKLHCLGDKNKDKIGQSIHNTMKQIIGIDLRLMDVADFAIAYVDPRVYTCGSMHEIAQAAWQRKPVLVFCPAGLDAIPLWLWGILKYQEFFETLSELREYITHIDSAQEVDDLNRWRFLQWSTL